MKITITKVSPKTCLLFVSKTSETMIQIIALIYAGKRGLEGLREFETKALSILREHSGSLVSASTSPDISAGPDEIHVIQFPSMDCFEAYKSDARLAELSSLRQEVISKVEIHITSEFHAYK